MLPNLKILLDENDCQRIHWPGMRVNTFTSLAQFAYTGDYVLTEHGMDGEPTTTKAGVKRKRKEADVRNMNYSALFLGHAQLYSLGTVSHAWSLQRLALNKIGDIFDHYSQYITHFSGSLDSLAELVEYVFSRPHIFANEKDGFRKLVLEHAVNKISWSGWTKGYVNMLKDGGEFAKSFWAQALKRFDELDPETERKAALKNSKSSLKSWFSPKHLPIGVWKVFISIFFNWGAFGNASENIHCSEMHILWYILCSKTRQSLPLSILLSTHAPLV